MQKPSRILMCAAPLALLLACGAVHAQIKPKPKPAVVQPAPSTPTTESQAADSQATDSRTTNSQTTPPETVVQEIANCMLAGVPKDWRTMQVEVIELDYDGKKREFVAKYSYTASDGKSVSYVPCDPKEPAINVYKLNGALEYEKRNWKKATLNFTSEGRFELKYDYAE